MSLRHWSENMKLWLTFFLQLLLTIIAFGLLVILITFLLISVYIKTTGGSNEDVKENIKEFSKDIKYNIVKVFKKED